MKKEHKEDLIKIYQQLFKTYDSLFLVKNCGLTVQNSKDIRGDMEKIGVRFIIVKNSLAKIAVKDSKFCSITDHFSGPVALACAEEPIATAKMLAKLIKDDMPFKVIAASVEDNILKGEEAIALAKLLSQNEVRAKILGLLKAVPNKLVALLNEPSSQLVRTFKAHATNKQ